MLVTELKTGKLYLLHSVPGFMEHPPFSLIWKDRASSIPVSKFEREKPFVFLRGKRQSHYNNFWWIEILTDTSLGWLEIEAFCEFREFQP